MLSRFSCKGKVALLSGAGRGIGRASALALAEAGADVVLAARSQDQLDAVAQEARALGVQALAVACDAGDPAQQAQLVARAVEVFGRLDIVVNVAGGSLPALIQDTTQRELEEAFHFNTGTAFELTRLALPHLINSGAGSVVNISTALSHYVESGFVAYGTAKAALNHMTRLMAYELAPKVRCNAIAVGAVETEALAMVLDDELKQKMLGLTPMARLGQPDDIALAVLYLASPASSWVTGKLLEVDGGTVASSWPLKMSAY